MYNRSLIPIKFLILITHFIICTCLLWNIQENMKFCLTEDCSQIMLMVQKDQLTIGLSITLGMIVFELLTFITGVTMFNLTASGLSILGHGSACILLCFFTFDDWDYSSYWLIFSMCVVFPFFHNVYTTFDVFYSKKY